MRCHTLIIAWFDHNCLFVLSASVSLSGESLKKKGCDVQNILGERVDFQVDFQEADFHPTENIYNFNISITRLYVQVLL